LGKSVTMKTAYVQIPQETTFYGQMGSFLFFGEALTASQVLELFILEFNYVPNFTEKDLLSRNGGPSILLAFHPGLVDSTTSHLTNLAQYQQMIFPYGGTKSRKAAAKKAGGLALIPCANFRDVVHCGMGVDSLLPLLYQKVHPQVFTVSFCFSAT